MSQKAEELEAALTAMDDDWNVTDDGDGYIVASCSVCRVRISYTHLSDALQWCIDAKNKGKEKEARADYLLYLHKEYALNTGK